MATLVVALGLFVVAFASPDVVAAKAAYVGLGLVAVGYLYEHWRLHKDAPAFVIVTWALPMVAVFGILAIRGVRWVWGM